MYNTLISAEQLAALTPEDVLIFDCRFNLADPEAGLLAYQQGHIPQAFYLDLNQDLSSAITSSSGRHPLPSAEGLAVQLNAYGLHQQQQVVVYDDCAGAMASRAWWLLRWLGHEEVAVLNGGLPVWQEQQVLSTDFPIPQQGDFAPKLQEQLLTSVIEVEQSLAANALQLIDARDVPRFRGEQEPIDPVAGHIPNALNRPLSANLNQGLFKSPGLLKLEFQSLLADVKPEQIVHYCGSGVTACHNLLAMEVAGLTNSRLYAGSWSEWIRDEERPVGRLS